MPGCQVLRTVACFGATGSTSRCLHLRGGSCSRIASVCFLYLPLTSAPNSCRHDGPARRLSGRRWFESGFCQHPAPSCGVSTRGLLRHHHPSATRVIMSQQTKFRLKLVRRIEMNCSPCARWSVCRFSPQLPTFPLPNHASDRSVWHI